MLPRSRVTRACVVQSGGCIRELVLSQTGRPYYQMNNGVVGGLPTSVDVS